jgi:uncharacterized RmlC-like cupin family protein
VTRTSPTVMPAIADALRSTRRVGRRSSKRSGHGAANEHDGFVNGYDIITVRPTDPVATAQRLPAFVGISAETAGSEGIGMNMIVIPPGASADPHYHDGFETAIYLLSGRVETRYGDGLAQSTINEAGDFLYIPAGVPHQPRNLSDTEPARALVARNTAREQESVVPYG